MGASDPHYDDLYPTCEYTHVTMRLYSDSISPEEMTLMFSCRPTSTQRKGDIRNPNGRRPITLKLNAWFLCSEGEVQSKDVRRHLDWLLDRLGNCSDALQTLSGRGARADIMCLWISKSGNGGPTLSPRQCQRIAELGVDCWFDV